MKQVIINVGEAIRKALPEVLKKDLQESEVICIRCHGLGMVSVYNPYGIEGEKSPDGWQQMFPYDNQALSFCPECYNGVKKTCKYCGKLIEKGHIDKCDCAEYEMEQMAAEQEKKNQRLRKAKEVPEDEVFTFLYCEELNKYYDSTDDFLEQWEVGHDEDDEIPEILWVTEELNLSFDVDNILEDACEDLHEDASDSCNREELQKLLDEYASRQQGTRSYYPCYEKYVRVERTIYER